MRAIFMKQQESENGQVNQKLYFLPRKRMYVVVSASTLPGRPETFIFTASADGNITNWTELSGSYVGGLSHEVALSNIGVTSIILPRTKGD